MKTQTFAQSKAIEKAMEGVKARTSKGSGFSGNRFAGKKGSKSGRRPDLENRFFRSMWEANFARYLNYCIANKMPLGVAGMQGKPVRWEFEPEEFKLFQANKEKSEYKNGARFYLPDFKVHLKDGTYVWVEVKGYMDATSRTKLERFVRCYPDEEIILLGPKTMKSINSIWGLKIPNWEFAVKP